MSTRILSVVETHKITESDEVVHDGYFIVSNNHPLKWARRKEWDSVSPAQLATNPDRVLAGLLDARTLARRGSVTRGQEAAGSRWANGRQVDRRDCLDADHAE